MSSSKASTAATAGSMLIMMPKASLGNGLVYVYSLQEFDAMRGRERRPMVRFFACEQDLSHESPDDPLPQAVASGATGAPARASDDSPYRDG